MRDAQGIANQEILMVKGCLRRKGIWYCSVVYRYEVYDAVLDAAVVCFVADNSSYSQRSAGICNHLPSNLAF